MTDHADIDHTGLTGVGGGISSGTSFPGSPSNNDLFYRTDHDLLFFYDGTRWLTVQLFRAPAYGNNLSGAVAVGRWPIPSGFDWWIVNLEVVTYVVTTNNGTNWWQINLLKTDASATDVSLGWINTSANSPDVYVRQTSAIGAAVGHATYSQINMTTAKTLSPGNLYLACEFTYRLIAT